jgi:PAS domain-containing protein
MIRPFNVFFEDNKIYLLPQRLELAIQILMECPSCKTKNPTSQKFCGSCGHKLEVTCIQCQATNPPHYKFCGHCGVSLADVGTLILARSGLITEVNQRALDMLGCNQKEMQGKPFSLFVERSDLVIFFSRLNELISTEKKQSFEIKLKHKDLE